MKAMMIVCLLLSISVCCFCAEGVQSRTTTPELLFAELKDALMKKDLRHLWELTLPSIRPSWEDFQTKKKDGAEIWANEIFSAISEATLLRVEELRLEAGFPNRKIWCIIQAKKKVAWFVTVYKDGNWWLPEYTTMDECFVDDILNNTSPKEAVDALTKAIMNNDLYHLYAMLPKIVRNTVPFDEYERRVRGMEAEKGKAWRRWDEVSKLNYGNKTSLGEIGDVDGNNVCTIDSETEDGKSKIQLVFKKEESSWVWLPQVDSPFIKDTRPKQNGTGHEKKEVAEEE